MNTAAKKPSDENTARIEAIEVPPHTAPHSLLRIETLQGGMTCAIC